ncbi:hypothetical protein ACWKSP_16020 [Micromonosporaceae bacterium Da 78-11]
MRSLGTRRVALITGAATVAVIALGGCSAGQVAETANLKAPISGLNTASPDGSLLIRNLQVVYNNPEGYPASGSAPIEVSLFNQTQSPITVTISSKPATTESKGLVSAKQVGVVGATPTGSAAASSEPAALPSASGSASASASAAPAAPAAQPAKFTIAPLSTETFLPGDAQSLQAIGLSDELRSGGSLSLVFEVSTSAQPLTVVAPFAIPMSAASREAADEHENEE